MSIPLSLAYIKSYLFVISIARKVMPRYSCSRSCFTMLLTPFPLLDGVFLDRSLFFLRLQFERTRKGVIISFYFFKSFQEKNILRVITARWSARRAGVSMKRKKGSSFYFTVFPYLFAAWVRTSSRAPAPVPYGRKNDWSPHFIFIAKKVTKRSSSSWNLFHHFS